MSYKFLNASLPIQVDPKTAYIGDFQNALYDGFKNASDWFTIQEEIPFATKTMLDVDVRINTAIDSITGEKLGDDYKLIMFEDLGHATGLGFFYFFDENWWVTINSEIIKNLAATATVRRCNNVLRWRDQDGGTYSVPCAIGDMIKMNRNLSSSGSAVIMPAGYIKLQTQFNSTTNKIKPNQRFLFGNPDNWVGYKVTGGGLQNFNNLQTEDNTTPGLIEIDLETNYVNPDTDDLTNGIADINEFIYTIELNNVNLSGQVSDTFQLLDTVRMGGEIVSSNVNWISSDITKASVNSSGLVTFVGTGSCVITCSLAVDSTIFTNSNVTVSSSPVTDTYIVISPTNTYVLEKTTQNYSVYLFKNGSQQSDTFTFSIMNSNVPVANYIFTSIDGNNFSVQNLKRYLLATLDINSVTGIYSESISINLKGAW